MAFDFKQAEKTLFRPRDVPVLVEVPRMSYLAVRGEGDPNESGGEYQQAVQYLSNAVTTRGISPRLKEKCLDLKEILNEKLHNTEEE